MRQNLPPKLVGFTHVWTRATYVNFIDFYRDSNNYYQLKSVIF